MLSYLIGILLFLAIGGSLFVYSLWLWNKAQNKIEEEIGMQAKMKSPNPFDNLIASGKNGMEVVNDFINIEFNKFLHNKLIGIEEDQPSINAFLNACKSGDYLASFVTGFVGTVNSQMSDGMKRFFNRYYKVLDEDGNVNDNYSKYITDWTNEAIRYLQLKFAIGDGDINNFSTQHTIDVSNKIFLQVEYDVYHQLGIAKEQEVTPNIQAYENTKNKLGGK